MIRLAVAALVTVVVGIPLAILPTAPVTWLTVVALAIGTTGALVLSVTLVTAGASLALIAYAVALALARPAADPLASVVLGGTLVLLLALVHFGSRIDGAVVGPRVVAGQIRHWMAIAALGVAGAAVLTLGGAVLGPALVGATLPVVVVAAGLGALLAVAGVIALVTAPRDSPVAATPAGRKEG
jgi:hypothetical protein